VDILNFLANTAAGHRRGSFDRGVLTEGLQARAAWVQNRGPAVERRQAPADPTLALAETLQSLRAAGVRGRPTALMRADRTVLCVVLPAAGTVISPHGNTALAAQLLTQFAYAQAADASHATLRATAVRPLDGLCWEFGHALAAVRGLLPWVRRLGGYRLISWPDFASLGADESGRRLAARLVERELSLSQVNSGVDAAAVEGLLNACALCGLLVGASAKGAYRAGVPGWAARLSDWWAGMPQPKAPRQRHAGGNHGA
jgi:hypothetical protein